MSIDWACFQRAYLSVSFGRVHAVHWPFCHHPYRHYLFPSHSFHALPYFTQPHYHLHSIHIHCQFKCYCSSQFLYSLVALPRGPSVLGHSCPPSVLVSPLLLPAIGGLKNACHCFLTTPHVKIRPVINFAPHNRLKALTLTFQFISKKTNYWSYSRIY